MASRESLTAPLALVRGGSREEHSQQHRLHRACRSQKGRQEPLGRTRAICGHSDAAPDLAQVSPIVKAYKYTKDHERNHAKDIHYVAWVAHSKKMRMISSSLSDPPRPQNILSLLKQEIQSASDLRIFLAAKSRSSRSVSSRLMSTLQPGLSSVLMRMRKECSQSPFE